MTRRGLISFLEKPRVFQSSQLLMVKKRGKVIIKICPIEKIKKNIAAIIGICGLILSIFFLSSNLTGYIIGNLNQTSSNWIGFIFFLIGLVGAFVYLAGKNKMTLEELGKEVEAERESVRGKNFLARASYQPSREMVLKRILYENISETKKLIKEKKGYTEFNYEATIKDPVFQYLACGGRQSRPALRRLVNRTMKEEEYNKLAKAAERDKSRKPIEIPLFRPYSKTDEGHLRPYPKSEEKPARAYRKE